MWEDLIEYRSATETRNTSRLFADDNKRAATFRLEADGLLLDYSKTSLDRQSLGMLLELVHKRQVLELRDRMFRGDAINNTERRPVLHTALRDPDDTPLWVDGIDLRPRIRAGRVRVADFADRVRSGNIQSTSGMPYTDIVNIGIGGSDLGPRLATTALAPGTGGPRIHFLSNIDGTQAMDILHRVDIRSTLFIVASKSFRTQETITNALTVKGHLETRLTEHDVLGNFVALTSAPGEALAFGIDPGQVFEFGDWVGGRYSLWSCIGLPIMIAAGVDRYNRMLDGAHAIDRHFVKSPPASNMPVLLALVGIWHNQVCGYPSRAILPYEHRLGMLPSYLQQLEMESNGKSVNRKGLPVDTSTIPVVWGSSGTDCQHSYFQMLHQGTTIVPCEFLVGARGAAGGPDRHHRMLLANCLAQSEALMNGRDADRTRESLDDGEQMSDMLVNSRSFDGNRPSTTLVYDQLTPYVLGQILALYEHRAFVEGAILGINSFDQWGVELGKVMADDLMPAIDNPSVVPDTCSASTRSLLEYISSRRTCKVQT